LLAVLSWAIYAIYLRKWNIHLPPIVLLTILTFLGSIGLFPLYYWESAHHFVYVFEYKHLYVFLYLAIFPSIIAYLLWMYTIKHLKQTVVAQFAYLQIIFTSTLAYVFLDEHMSLFHVTGGVLIVAGLYFSHQTATNALNHSS
jgi:drug/metabolite transporter (DMT)-like permease